MQEPLRSSLSQDLLEKQKHDHEEPLNPKPKGNSNNKRLGLISVIFLIYFQVSGGPYGQEPVVGAAAPFFAVLGFFLFPVLWSLPEALVAAELSAAFPANAGYVLWAHTAFGPFWAYLMGSWRFLAGVINLSAFPTLCVGYVEAVAPELLSSALRRFSVVLFSTSALSLINFSGLHVAGYAAIPLGVSSLVPFLALSLAAIPNIDPGNWIAAANPNRAGFGRRKEWKRFFNSLFWNLNSWDSVSTLAGEVNEAEKTLPKALLSSLGFTSAANLIPLLASTGAMSPDMDDWKDGYYADVAEELAGPWLKRWVKFGSVLSGCGLYQAQLSSCSYQLHGMAELGLIPSLFAARCPRFGTPWAGIAAATVLSLTVSALRVEDVRAAVNFLYGMGSVVVFGSFVLLRARAPEAERPFRVPVGFRGVVAMCSVPCMFVFYVICVASFDVYLVSFVMSLVGVLSYFTMKILRAKRWVDFNEIVDYSNNKILHQDPIITTSSFYENEKIEK